MSDKIDDTMDYDSNNKHKAFDNWFYNFLLHKTVSCLDRDILRWAKPVLKVGFFEQMNSEGNELTFNGAKKYLELEAKLNECEATLKQRDELLREACEFLDSDVFERRFQYKYRMLEEDPLVCPKEQFLNKPEIKQIMEEDNE